LDFECDLTKPLPFADGEFDTIILSDVLEHVPQPERLWSEIALSAIPGAVFSGSIDGHLRAFATTDGRLLWDFDTARDYTTVNGVAAKGGSLDGAGAVIVDGMVFVSSGYPRFGGMPGNVLLAFGRESNAR
jgi:SAM-dependent methyltransferase